MTTTANDAPDPDRIDRERLRETLRRFGEQSRPEAEALWRRIEQRRTERRKGDGDGDEKAGS